MRGASEYVYVYGGTATVQGQIRDLDGTASCPEQCDETRLRAAAVRDVSRSEGVPLASVEITDFWYSEFVIGGVPSPDPFRPHGIPGTTGQRDTVDPFSPGPGHPCTGDI